MVTPCYHQVAPSTVTDGSNECRFVLCCRRRPSSIDGAMGGATRDRLQQSPVQQGLRGHSQRPLRNCRHS